MKFLWSKVSLEQLYTDINTNTNDADTDTNNDDNNGHMTDTAWLHRLITKWTKN